MDLKLQPYHFQKSKISSIALLYADEDPAQVYYEETTLRVFQESGNYILEVYLPSIPKSQIQLHKTGDELNIRIGNHRRNLVLPQALAALQPVGAKMETDYLRIQFAAEASIPEAA
ncbi:Arsenite-activated ATPase ArsA (fragment) [Hyella patelloides LEGE 07179]|uniref:Arsenite-activated ATPase ArsA n=1 Tax=Hyella patelloides LEGE 07179 TaxID=945734 RepID=A0A563VP13_9CYAN